MEHNHFQVSLQSTQHARQVLKAAKLKVTPWRKRLASVVLAEARPLSRLEIGKELSRFELPIGGSTLKYLVDDFVAAGILEKVQDDLCRIVKYQLALSPETGRPAKS